MQLLFLGPGLGSQIVDYRIILGVGTGHRLSLGGDGLLLSVLAAVLHFRLFAAQNLCFRLPFFSIRISPNFLSIFLLGSHHCLSPHQFYHSLSPDLFILFPANCFFFYSWNPPLTLLPPPPNPHLPGFVLDLGLQALFLARASPSPLDVAGSFLLQDYLLSLNHSIWGRGADRQ